MDTTNTTRQLTAFGTLQMALESKKAASTDDCVVDIEVIREGTVTIRRLKEILEEQGIIVIQNASTTEGARAAREALAKAYETDVVPQLSLDDNGAGTQGNVNSTEGQDILETVKKANNWPSGIVGNKTFGFLYAQPEANEDAQSLELSEDLRVVVSPCSGYKANLELLTHPSNEVALATLLAITGNKNGIVSQDSVKMHRENLTQPHVDIYGNDETKINRTQAMYIGPGEGDVRLCFARYSHLLEIQTLISDAVERPNFYDRTGFMAFPKQTRTQMIECLKAAGVLHIGSPGELVIWKSGVVHTELKLKGDNLILKNKDTSGTTERYVVGTHQPYNLSQRQLLEIGYVADHGFIFHPYNRHNEGNAAGDNSVHRKTTLYKRQRVIPQTEKDRFAATVKGLSNEEQLEEWQQKQNPRTLHCLGVSQPPDKLFTDQVARQIFTEN